MADSEKLIGMLLESGHTVTRRSGSTIVAYFDEDHERCDLFSAGQHYGYIITGIETYDGDSVFLGRAHFSKAKACDIAGVEINEVDNE